MTKAMQYAKVNFYTLKNLIDSLAKQGGGGGNPPGVAPVIKKLFFITGLKKNIIFFFLPGGASGKAYNGRIYSYIDKL